MSVPRWTDDRLDDAFREIRDDLQENRRECRDGHAAVMARLDSQDNARDAARAETRRAIVTGLLVLMTAIVTASGGIVVAIVTDKPNPPVKTTSP